MAEFFDISRSLARPGLEFMHHGSFAYPASITLRNDGFMIILCICVYVPNPHNQNVC